MIGHKQVSQIIELMLQHNENDPLITLFQRWRDDYRALTGAEKRQAYYEFIRLSKAAPLDIEE